MFFLTKAFDLKENFLWITYLFFVEKIVEKMCISGKLGGAEKRKIYKNRKRMNKNYRKESYPQKLLTLWITLSTECGQACFEK